jgi:CRISPR/Cas system-associated exonuclease Cas4 (RecB family)
MDPLTRGALFHEAQFAFFESLASGPARPALDLVDEALDRVAAKYEEELAPAIPRVWKSEVEDLRADLRAWINVATYQFQTWMPVHYEFSFGLTRDRQRDPASVPHEAVILDGVRVRGSVDLIERKRTGELLRVTDHKTGRPPETPPAYVGKGTHLQPLIYSLAVEKLLGEQVSGGRFFYCTHRGGYLEREIKLNNDARASIAIVLGEINDAIERGFLPAAPAPGTCDYCDYRPVCGPYEEERLKKKDGARLNGLLEIRGLA